MNIDPEVDAYPTFPPSIIYGPHALPHGALNFPPEFSVLQTCCISITPASALLSYRLRHSTYGRLPGAVHSNSIGPPLSFQ